MFLVFWRPRPVDRRARAIPELTEGTLALRRRHKVGVQVQMARAFKNHQESGSCVVHHQGTQDNSVQS